ncbi:MAG: class I fructose-bisphosphate aldolase [Anaerolineae bacterium]
MGLGKTVRLKRLFGDPSGRLCSVAVDHYINYPVGVPRGLRNIRETLAAVVAGRPDAITMHKGVAAAAWEQHAGTVPFILQCVAGRPDDTACEIVAHADEAVRLGADAIAGAAFIRGRTEAEHLRLIADMVREAAPYDLPVILHIYPRRFAEVDSGEGFAAGGAISLAPEDIDWAVHCALEIGADVIKTPYCGDVAAFRDIVSACPRPVVIAGGPQTPTLRDALAMTGAAMAAGARGATVGRNIWGSPRITNTVLAFKAVVHDDASPDAALVRAGLD